MKPEKKNTYKIWKWKLEVKTEECCEKKEHERHKIGCLREVVALEICKM